MSKKWKIALVVAGVILALVAGGVAVTGYTLAQRLPPDRTTDEGGPGPWMMGGRRGGFWMGGEDHEAYREQFIVALAEELGIAEEDLQAALDEGRNPFQLLLEYDIESEEFDAAMSVAVSQVIDEAVADGAMPEAVAEWITGQVMDKVPPMGWMLDYYDEMQASVAEHLGVSIEDVEAVHAEGKSPVEIAEELGIEPEELRDAMETAWQEAIDQAVVDGALTEEEAERLSRFGPGKGPGVPRCTFGRGGRRGGRMGFGPELPEDGE